MRALARLVALLGAVGVAWILFGQGPKDVVLVYDVSAAPGATSLEVELRRGPELVRRAEFRVAGTERVRHELKLPAGEYEIAWRVSSPDGERHGRRPLEVREDGTIVLPLGR